MGGYECLSVCVCVCVYFFFIHGCIKEISVVTDNVSLLNNMKQKNGFGCVLLLSLIHQLIQVGAYLLYNFSISFRSRSLHLLKEQNHQQQCIDSSPKDAVCGDGGRIRHVWCRLFRHP